MTTQANKDLSRRFLEELWNQKNVSIVGELLANTYVDHTPGTFDEGPQGPEALRQLFEALHRDFSDIRASIEDQIAEEDKVMTRVTWVCTLTSDDPSAVSQVTVMGVGIDRIDQGKIVESWNALDVPYRLLNLLEGPDAPNVPHPPPVPCDRDNPCRPGFMCRFGTCHRV